MNTRARNCEASQPYAGSIKGAGLLLALQVNSAACNAAYAQERAGLDAGPINDATSTPRADIGTSLNVSSSSMHLVQFLRRFCEDRAFAWRHVRLPQRVLWIGGEVVLRRRDTSEYNEFFFCNGFEYHDPNIVISSRTSWSARFETGRIQLADRGAVGRLMRFEWLDSRWQLVRCVFCGEFASP